MHLTLSLLQPPYRPEAAERPPAATARRGYRCRWGGVGRLLGWCTSWGGGAAGCCVCLRCGAWAHWPWPPPSAPPRWWRRSPQLTTQAGDVDMTAGARVARVVGRWYDRLGTARHGTSWHAAPHCTAPRHAEARHATAARHDWARLGTPRFGSAQLSPVRPGSATLSSARRGPAQLGSTQPGSSCPAPSARLGYAQLGSARLGSA